jgi:hypothetical protein
MYRAPIIILLALALAAPALAAEPAADGGTISIMKPEPAATTKKKSTKTSTKTRKTRGSSNPVYPIPLPGPQKLAPIPRIETAKPGTKTPPPLYVPQTGRLLPNLPATGSGAGGAESFQDRAARCVHQSGVYGPNATGDPGSYIRSCINQ